MITQSYFNQSGGDDTYDIGNQLMLGQVEKIHYIDDTTNVSKQYVEYDVSVRDSHGGQTLLRNIRKLELLGGSNDFSEVILEANDFAAEGKLEQANLFKNKNGSVVIVGYINGNFEKPFILGALAHPKTTGSALAKGVHKSSEFRGFKQEIDKDGNLTLTALGAKTPDGKPADLTFTPLTLRIGKNGTIETATGHKITFGTEQGKQQIKIQTSANQLFIIDDTTGIESISMLQKKGGLINIDKDGSVTATSADGNLLFLNAVAGEASLIQKNGTMLALSATAATLSDSSGKQIISVNEDTVQITSSKDVTTQTSGYGVQAGTVDLKDTLGAGLKIANGMVALGGPTAELLDLVDQIIDSIVKSNTAAAAIIVPTAVGPSGPPTNAALFTAEIAALTAIKILLTTIKGTL